MTKQDNDSLIKLQRIDKLYDEAWKEDILEHYVIDGIEFKEFLLDGTLTIVAKRLKSK